ncbi:MAG TPA: hypothetical protein VL485_05875, partial [Ktedonobacteraceae bacterium]|nr:hypothetical protein [Ktedonobacteraceae bacterium]
MQQDSSDHLLAHLIEGEEQKRNSFSWWYRLAALPDAPISASLEERERVRRSRLTATILFGVLCIVIVVFFMGFIIHNLIISAVMVGGIISTSFIAFLNHKGFHTLAGILLILQIDGGQTIAFFHLPGGLDLAHMILLDLLFVIGEIAAVSFFPSGLLFLCALFNCVVLTLVMRFGPVTPDLKLIATTPAGFQYYADPFLVQGIIAVISFLWNRSVHNAIERADRAHVIASLEHQIAEQLHIIGEEKQQLEESIQLILDTHVRVANGDLDARVPLSQDNTLWPLAGSLNTLLSRYRHYYQLALAYHNIEQEIQLFSRIIQNAKYRSIPIQVVQRGTSLDLLYLECNGYLLSRYEGPTQNPVRGYGQTQVSMAGFEPTMPLPAPRGTVPLSPVSLRPFTAKSTSVRINKAPTPDKPDT